MSNSTENEIDQDVAERLLWAVEIAEAAGALTLDYFRNPELGVEHKSDNSPVTVADREAEQLLRKKIAERYPDDGILGEEFGKTDGSSGFQWILDPIDGTKSFVHGVPLYTTLVAVMKGEDPQLGVIHAPACRETVYAQLGGGCWYRSMNADRVETRQVACSRVGKLKEALTLTTESDAFRTDRSTDAMGAYLELDEKSRILRTWGDAYGYLMVATGRAEVMIDPIVNLWDIAALLPVVSEAGGRFTDWQGNETVHAGEAVATNGLLGEEVLEILKQFA